MTEDITENDPLFPEDVNSLLSAQSVRYLHFETKQMLM